MNPLKRSVVITGIGPICSISDSPESFWEALCDGTTSITGIEDFDASGFTSQYAGQVSAKVRDWVPKSYRKATKVMARDTELGVIAAKIAADHAGLLTSGSDEGDSGFQINQARTGCQIGAGLIAADTAEMSRAVVTATDSSGAFNTKEWGTEDAGQAGMNNLPPLWLLKYLPNMPACHVTIIHGLQGPSNTIMGAEAGALLSIIESTRVIRRNAADMCLTGGAESRINPLGLLRWDYAGRLAETGPDADPSQILKPFDPASKGSIMGEAGGMLVVEEENHARARNATAFARITGYATTQSINPTLPIFEADPADDEALSRAIDIAIAQAGLTPDDIDVVLPLGIGDPELDTREAGAIRRSLGSSAETVPIVTLTERIGNTLSAHAGLMTAAGALILHHQHLPANTRTLDNSGVYTPEKSQPIQHILICTSSLAGQCGALVLSHI
ncbi:MAG: beta-ketoacyl-[acyl-carrier-protein] synthase family protein [Phycisphaerales bacterium]